MPHGILRSLALAGFLAALNGCGANARPQATSLDLSKPKPAALSFLHAIAQENAGAAKAAAVGTDDDKRWIDATVALIKGLRAYDQALVGRFGQPAIPTDVQLKQAISALTDEPIMRFEGAVVKEAEDTALVQPALNGVKLAAQAPLPMRKEKGQWKVDLAALRDQPQHDSDSVRQLSEAGRALQRAAQAVRAGRYRTFEEAMQAVDQQVPGG